MLAFFAVFRKKCPANCPFFRVFERGLGEFERGIYENLQIQIYQGKRLNPLQ